MNRGDVIGVLNDLIETSLDGDEGFRTCADNVKNPSLKSFFAQKAARCREGAAQLQHIVREMGGEPETASSASGAVHRFWVNIRGTLSGMDDTAILAECERGEDTAKSVFENALRQDLPGDVRRIVERQFQEVTANHDRIKAMREMKAGA
jgi:uncharacterized protein (TIGR02284 family)